MPHGWANWARGWLIVDDVIQAKSKMEAEDRIIVVVAAVCSSYRYIGFLSLRLLLLQV